MTARKSYSSKRAKQRTGGRRSALTAIGIAAGGLILVGVLLLAVTRTTAGSIVPARVGSTLSDFTLTDLFGKQVRLSDYAGRPVLVNAWATWCPPCRAEMPALHDFYQAHQAEGFTLLAVNAGESQSQVQSFIQQMGFTFPVLLDPNTSLLDALGIHSYPTSILVGRDGTIKTIHVGMLTVDQLQTEIAPLLSQ